MRWKYRYDDTGFLGHRTSCEAETPEVDAFIEEVLSVCKKHGFSISHEDGHGAFLIEKFSNGNADWLMAAGDDTESPY